MNNRNIKPISPFILFCQKVIPLAFDESMSYYECLCALTNYLYSEVIPAVNNNADAVTELQTYVANYFKNLDVQEEINNKLDMMVEDGTLANIINNTIFNELNEQVNTNTQNISNNSKEIDILKNRKYIFFGDSYASGETGTSWLNNIVNYLGLSSTDYFNASRNSYGFTYPSSTQNWETVLDYTITQISNKNDYTDILVAGGYNDGAPYNSSTQQDIENAIQSFVTKCKNNFPNAKITIAHIGWTGNMDNFEGLRKSIKAYKNCTNFGASYINNSEFIMHNYTLYNSDYIHPNATGNENIAKYLINGLLTGSCDVYYEVPITLSNLTSIQLQNYQVISITHNEISSIEFRNLNKNQMLIQSNNDNNVPLTQFIRSELFGIGNNLSTCYAGNNEYDSNTQLINCYYQDTENNSGILPILVNVNNYKFQFINLGKTKNIKFIGIPSFSINQLSLYC